MSIKEGCGTNDVRVAVRLSDGSSVQQLWPVKQQRRQTWHYCCLCKSQPVAKFLVKSWKTILQTHKNTWGGWTGHSKRDSLRNGPYGARPIDENVRKMNVWGDYYRHGEWKWSKANPLFSQWCWVHWWRCMFFLPEEVQQDPPEAPDSPVITFTLPRLHGSNLGLLMSCSWGQFIRNIPGPTLSSEADMFMVVWSGRVVESTT